MDAKILHELLEYKEGNLYWKVDRSYKAKAGCQAGHVAKNGYRYFVINRKRYLTHRVVFFLFNGWIPEKIDHIDNDRLNNKLENLRPADDFQNSHNSKIRNNNTSGVKGISWCNRKLKWKAEIGYFGQKKTLGYFKDLDNAKSCIMKARSVYHGEFANHG